MMESKPTIRYSVWDSPIGTLGIAVTGKGVSHLYFVRNEKDFYSILSENMDAAFVKDPPATIPVVNELKDYFSGKLRKFQTPIDIVKGTEFQRTIWNMLLKIPYGEVRTYGWFAEKLKIENGARAVGTANGQNPVSIIIPCHRVINSNGKLGGYGGGLDKKRWLLKLEGSLTEFAF